MVNTACTMKNLENNNVNGMVHSGVLYHIRQADAMAYQIVNHFCVNEFYIEILFTEI